MTGRWQADCFAEMIESCVDSAGSLVNRWRGVCVGILVIERTWCGMPEIAACWAFAPGEICRNGK